MPEAVSRMLTLLCALVVALPVGTNLGLLHLFWMLVSGHLLSARGAVIPGLSGCGLSARAVRRAWAALGQGDWTSAPLLARWQALVTQEGRWQPHRHGGYHPLTVDLTGFWRPRLHGCPTTHFHATAGKALPAIVLGLIAQVGSSGGQRLALPRAFVRADPADPRASTHARLLVRAAVAQCAPDEALVLDAGFGLALLQAEGATRYVVRCAKNATFRRARPPAYSGRGRPPTRGQVVRPLPRRYKGRAIAASRPDRTATWEEDGCVLRADLGRPGVARRHAGRPHRPRGRYPRSALSGAAAPGLPASRRRRRAARPLSRPLAGGATPLGRQTDARCRPRLRACARDLPAAARAGPPRRRDPVLCGGHRPRHPDRLLGPPSAAYTRPPAPGPRPQPFSA